MLDRVDAKELSGRKPMKGSHGEIVAAILVDSEQPTKIGERVEGMGVIETLLVFAVAAFHLAVVPRGIRPDKLVTNALVCKCRFKQRRDIAFAVGEAVGKLKAIISLHTFNLDSAVSEPSDGFQDEVRRGVGTLLRVSPKKTKP